MSRVLQKIKPAGAYRPIYDLSGQRFGDIKVIRLVSAKPVKWECECVCGKRLVRSSSEITRTLKGKSNSCGCKRTKSLNKFNTVHGFAHRGRKERLYRIWTAMRNRCGNPQNSNFKWYGAEGKSVCREWSSYPVFRDWAMANGYSDGLEIDRINNSDGYNPDNCRWVTHLENMQNTRRQYV